MEKKNMKNSTFFAISLVIVSIQLIRNKNLRRTKLKRRNEINILNFPEPINEKEGKKELELQEENEIFDGFRIY